MIETSDLDEERVDHDGDGFPPMTREALSAALDQALAEANNHEGESAESLFDRLEEKYAAMVNSAHQDSDVIDDSEP